MPITVEKLIENKQNNIFVETGSLFGDGIQAALDSGYEYVISIECNQKYYDHCTERFEGNDKVKIVLGDSSKDLFAAIENVEEPMTFFLDAHYMWHDPDQKLEEHPGNGKIPLVDELMQIKKHSIKNHIIIVDDLEPLSCLTPPTNNDPPTGSVDTQLDNIKSMIKSINPDYEFEIVSMPGFTVFLVSKVL